MGIIKNIPLININSEPSVVPKASMLLFVNFIQLDMMVYIMKYILDEVMAKKKNNYQMRSFGHY